MNHPSICAEQSCVSTPPPQERNCIPPTPPQEGNKPPRGSPFEGNISPPPDEGNTPPPPQEEITKPPPQKGVYTEQSPYNIKRVKAFVLRIRSQRSCVVRHLVTRHTLSKIHYKTSRMYVNPFPRG